MNSHRGPGARRARGGALVIVLAVGCGADSAQMADASPDVDAFEAPVCTRPKVFINTLAGGPETYTPGPDSASTNRSIMLSQPATVGPADLTLVAQAIDRARLIFEPLGIELTDVDPQGEPHIEVVMIGTGWPLPPSFAANAPIHCDGGAEGVAMVNLGIRRGPGDLAVSMGYTIGLLAGLEALTGAAGNCMSTSVQSTCTFADQVTVSAPRCGASTQQQQALLRLRLGC